MRFLFLSFVLAFTLAQVQSQHAKQYVMVEHFTNTLCSICASRNPAMYTTLNNNPGYIHHVSIHSSVPYPQCVLYGANMSAQDLRKDLYTIQGTPTTVTNGTIKGLGSGLMPQSRIDNIKGTTSPLRIKVVETKMPTLNRQIDITVKTFDTIQSTSLKYWIMLVEKVLPYNAPNGETIHYDVFRTFRPANDGVAFTPAPIGQEVNITYNTSLSAAWDTSEIYALVFIQDTLTNEIINSGTKFDLLMDPVISDEDCINAANGSIDLNMSGGRAPYNFSWSNGATTEIISGLAAGSYTVTVTDADGQEYINEMNVNVNSSLSSTTSYTPTVSNDGTATVDVTGGSPPYMYMWSSGDMAQTAINLGQGVVTVTVTDANNCMLVDSVEVLAISLIDELTHVSCYAGSDGSAKVMVNGGEAPYSYSWSTGAQTDFISGLTAGTYSVTVTDNANNVIEGTYTITQPDSISITGQVTPENASAGDGSITLNVTGGSPPYQYTWDNGAATSSIQNLSEGTYNVDVTDNNGCTTQEMFLLERIVTGLNSDRYDNYTIDIFPNPADSRLSVDLSQIRQTATIRLLDVLGKQIVIRENASGLVHLEVEELSAGLYFVHINSGGYNVVEQVVIE